MNNSNEKKSGSAVWKILTYVALLVAGFFLHPVLQPMDSNIISGEKSTEVQGEGMKTDESAIDEITLYKTKYEELSSSYDVLQDKYNALEGNNKSGNNAKFAYLSLTKMNTLYIGVNNTISLTTNGVDSKNLNVDISGEGATIKRAGDNYTVSVSKPGACAINVNGDGISFSKEYMAKPIPNPIAKVNDQVSGPMSADVFKGAGGVSAVLDNFDFDARCNISGFNLVYLARRSDPVESSNSGPRFNAKSKRLINRAKPGDIYFFTNVKARCPGDAASRSITPIVVEIR